MPVAPKRLIYLISGSIAAAAGGIWWGVVADLPAYGPTPRIPWWILLPAAFVIERTVFNIEFRTESISFTMGEFVFVAGAFFADPTTLVVATLAGRGLALLRIRPPIVPVKVAFNLAHFALNTVLMLALFRWLAPDDGSIGPQAWGALFAGLLAASLINSLSLTTVVAIAERRRLRIVPRQLGLFIGVDVVNASLALVGTIAFAREPISILFLLPPAALLFATYRMYVAQREDHRRLLELYEASRALQDQRELYDVLRVALEYAREMFRGTSAIAILVPDDRSGTGVRAEARGDDVTMEPTTSETAEGCIELLQRRTGAYVLEDARADPLVTACAGRIVRDAVIAPLMTGGKPTGLLIVSDRRGQVGSFADVSLPVVKALAAAVAAAAAAAHLLERLRGSLDEATVMSRMKDLFVATVSHELRTPLTGIEGYVRTLMRGDVVLDEKDRAMCLDGILRQSQRLSTVVEDMLTVTGLVSGDLRPKLAPLSAPAIVRSLAARWTNEARPVETDVGEITLHVLSDPTIVQRILTLLLDNAFKFSPPGSRVKIGVVEEGEGVRFSVRDTGPGIEEHVRESIFESFYQADASNTRSTGGMGLGLFVARRLAQTLSGRLWLERTGPDGSEFALWLPGSRSHLVVTSTRSNGTR